MATYHCSVKHGSHGNGASASAKADYISREGKYSDKPDLEFSASGNMPEWAQENPRDFWQAADNYERANGRLYTEVEIALPREISAEQRQRLVDEFAKSELKGLPYTAAIHNPKAGIEGGEQPHAHIVFSERKLDGINREEDQFFKRANTKEPEKGGCAKDRSWNDKEKVQQIRESWERQYNRYSQDKVSCKSLKEQGIDRDPERHIGPKKTRSPEVAQIIERRRHLKELPEIDKEMRSLSKQIEQEKVDQVRKVEPVAQAKQVEPPKTEVGKETPAFDPTAGRKRLTEIDNTINEIERRHAPTAVEIEAHNKRQYPELEASRQAGREAKAKVKPFNSEVEKWKEDGARNGWKSDNDSMLRSPAQRAWQKEGEELQMRHKALSEEKRQTTYKLERVEHEVRMHGGAGPRKEAAARRDADPEYQKLKVEQNAIKAALREEKKEREKEQERSR
jgi:hypothetical protein